MIIWYEIIVYEKILLAKNQFNDIIVIKVIYYAIRHLVLYYYTTINTIQ